MQRSFALSLSFVALSLLLLAGCAGGEALPPNYKTTVEISYQGAPVDGAMVTLRPDGHQAPSANGVTGADGKVQLFSYKGKGAGVVPGKYLVGVEKQKVESAEPVDSDAEPADSDDETSYKERVDVLPAKYITASESGLTCTVTEDASQNVFKFELED